jgi:hypothetical protein
MSSCTGTPPYPRAGFGLDLEDPTRVIGRTMSWLLAPEADYEARWQVDNVVFPCGAIAEAAKDELRLYYRRRRHLRRPGHRIDLSRPRSLPPRNLTPLLLAGRHLSAA